MAEAELGVDTAYQNFECGLMKIRSFYVCVDAADGSGQCLVVKKISQSELIRDV